jgi:hypothetical protein
MSVTEEDVGEIRCAAYDLAWNKFAMFISLTLDEKASGPGKLREYINILVATGERNPQKIANSALGLVRKYEQIARSQARVASPSIEP